ncbi:MAG: DUF4159 domain-containing protein [Phaeospirillum sp.]|nr:DUF4159 domain-containing protein [Phaeospirillum sp.]
MNFVFAAPWALGLLALLPLLWRLLRVTPPEPARVRFPAIRLLLGLPQGQDAADSTPPWLLALRLALAAALILAAARPLLDPAKPQARSDGTLMVVVDDGWAAARDWPARRAYLDTLLAGAERAARPVLLLGTAPPADGGPIASPRLMPAAEARAALAGMEPKPWPTDRRAALKALGTLEVGKVARTVWLTDGLNGEGSADLARTLQSAGGRLELVHGRTGRQLLPPAEDSPPDRLVVAIRRLPGDGPERVPERVVVRGLDAAGVVLARDEVVMEAASATVSIILPVELRNRLARLDIEGERGAGSVVLLDERWRRRSVGLVGDERASGAPLLDRLYYLERALTPHADVRRGGLAELIGENAPAVLILADTPLVPGALADRLAALVEQGRVVVRFGGPLLAQAASGATGDPLLPVRLRDGGRAMGGAMSWTTPMGLAPFGEGSPFRGLQIPAEVEVKAQVLAEPSLELASHTWASLTDGTPLVTARRQGKGWLVLIHTGANAEWSNLALSGLFVDMLRRVVALSQGGDAAVAGGALSPAELLDGFGRLAPPSGAAAAITEGVEATRPGPRHPPGLYGPADGRVAFNLGPRLPPPQALPLPSGALVAGLEGGRAEIDLGPALLVLALLLAMVDGVATLLLRGRLRRALPLAALLPVLAGAPAQAGDAIEAALATRLACVKTHDVAIDRDCLAGLKGLSAVIALRSTANLAEPMTVDPERDPVVFFPLLYWRIGPSQRPLSAAAMDRLNAYMARGGLIVFDTGDEGQPAAGPDTAELNRLRAVVQGLALPPLTPLAPDHVLNRAFYLLKEVPGRWDGTSLWVEQPGGSGANDGVSPVVLGGNDWVGAWAVDERGRPLHAVVPGGERQREMAYRFGVNLVMYALTGNYKADQVHLPAILERLGR